MVGHGGFDRLLEDDEVVFVGPGYGQEDANAFGTLSRLDAEFLANHVHGSSVDRIGLGIVNGTGDGV